MRLNLDRQLKPELRGPRIKALSRFHAWLGALLGLLAFVSSPQLQAQNNQPAANLSSRFLIIVETSSAMQRHVPETLKVVGDIITSGAGGQIHFGDTIGLWTFDKDVHSDLPVQAWSEGQQAAIALRTTNFLEKQFTNKPAYLSQPDAFQRGGQISKSPSSLKPARFDEVLPYMFEVIGASDTITIFIISTGDGKMKGTPFDAEINTLYAQNIKDMKGRRMPIVTVLQARSGKLLHFTMNALPWPIVMPEPLIALSVPKKSAPAVAPKKSPATNQTVVTAPAITATVTPRPQTPPPAPTPAPTPTPNRAPIVVPTSPPVPSTPPPAIEVAQAHAPTTLELGNRETSTPLAPHDERTPKSLGNVSLEISDASTHKTNANATATPAAIPAPTAPSPQPVQSAPESVVVKNSAPATNPIVVSSPPVRQPLVASNPAPVAASKPIVTAPVNPPPPPISAPSTASPPPPVLATASPEVNPRSKGLLAAGIGLAIIALVLIFLIIRRSRDTSGPSLITRSMGNRKR